jgi:hypothetical protein
MDDELDDVGFRRVGAFLIERERLDELRPDKAELEASMSTWFDLTPEEEDGILTSCSDSDVRLKSGNES